MAGGVETQKGLWQEEWKLRRGQKHLSVSEGPPDDPHSVLMLVSDARDAHAMVAVLLKDDVGEEVNEGCTQDSGLPGTPMAQEVEAHAHELTPAVEVVVRQLLLMVGQVLRHLSVGVCDA